jgi:hypothetical protein
MKAGAVKGLSVGYNTLMRTFKGGVRHLQEIAIGEVSLCPFPMNPLAEVDSVKDLSGYEQTEGLNCLLAMIRAGADFLVEEVEEGDTADASRMQSILTSLAKLLASELSEVATEPDESGYPDDDVQSYDESMSAVIDGAIKTLTALSTHDTAHEAEEVEAELGVADLRALLAEMRSSPPTAPQAHLASRSRLITPPRSYFG